MDGIHKKEVPQELTPAGNKEKPKKQSPTDATKQALPSDTTPRSAPKSPTSDSQQNALESTIADLLPEESQTRQRLGGVTKRGDAREITSSKPIPSEPKVEKASVQKETATQPKTEAEKLAKFANDWAREGDFDFLGSATRGDSKEILKLRKGQFIATLQQRENQLASFRNELYDKFKNTDTYVLDKLAGKLDHWKERLEKLRKEDAPNKTEIAESWYKQYRSDFQAYIEQIKGDLK